jgi:cyclopropane fatty-acyl-phospholipid synthase-like methyltransferase
MSDGPAVYDAAFYAALAGEGLHQQRAILGVCALLGVPPSYCDVGCGAGTTVDTMARLIGPAAVLGYERPEFFAWRDSLDPAARPKGAYAMVDLDRAQLPTPDPPYALVTSWEVGEHLQPATAPTYARFLAALTRPGGSLVFTAARPGQPGHGHINCQPKSYWVDQLTAVGFGYAADRTEWLTTVWNCTVNPLLHLRDNCLVFRREA